MLVGNNVHSFSQSFNYTQYYNQAMQKAQNIGSEIGKSLQSSSQFAMRPTNKDIYVLYLNGNKMACFSDEWSCKAQINSIKARMESAMESLYNGLPAEIKRQIGNQWRNDIKTAINGFNFTYRKESNPNYRPSSTITNNNNGYNSSDFQGINYVTTQKEQPDSYALSRLDNSGQILGSPFDVENQRTKISITNQSENNELTNINIPSTITDAYNKYSENKEEITYLIGKSGVPISGKPSEWAVNTQNDIPVLQVTGMGDINKMHEEYIKKQENEQKDYEKQLEGMKTSMTDDQYFIILAKLYAENGNIRPEYIGSKDGEYFFKFDDNTVYAICPNSIFSFVTMSKKNPEKAELKMKDETSYSVITSGGKMINFASEKKVDGNMAWKNDPLETSQGFEINVSQKRQILFSDINADIVDGKLKLYMVEAHISGEGKVGLSSGVEVSPSSKKVDVIGSGFEYKKDERGFEIDGSFAGPAAGVTAKNNNYALRVGADVEMVSITGEIGIKKVDCTDLFKNDPKAVVNYLKSEVKSLEKQSNVSFLQATGVMRQMNEEAQKEVKEKIKHFNNLIEKINNNGLTNIM